MAQDPFFSRMTNSIYNSPASSLTNLDGETSKGQITLNYRDQWSKVSNAAFRTGSIEGNFRIYESSIDCWNIGAVLLNDRSNNAILKTNNIFVNTAYSRKFSQQRTRSNIVTVGASLSYNSTNIDIDDLWFGRQYDLTNFELSQNMSNGETTILDNRRYFSISAGARWIARFDTKHRLTLSLASHHINKPTVGLNEDQTSLASRIFTSAIYQGSVTRFLTQDIGLSYTQQLNSFQLNPFYQIKYALPDNDDVSLLMALSARVANSINGVLLDAIIPSVGMRSREWEALLSYDINVSSLQQTTPNTGALELTLGYYLKS